MSDRRRILVPHTAQPITYADSPTSSLTSSSQKIYLRTSLLPDASGSAYFEHQQHKILVLVNGPKPQRGSFSSSAKLLVDVKFLPVSSDAHVLGIQQGLGFETDLEKSLAEFVYTSLVPAIRLGQYPKSGINVSIVVISGPPESKALVKQVAAACVTTAGAAIVDAGIEVLDVVTACAVKISTKGDISVDFDYEQESKASARAVISSMSSRDEITGFWIDEETEAASIEGEILTQVLQVASAGAIDVRKLVNSVLYRSLDGLESKGKNGKRSADSISD